METVSQAAKRMKVSRQAIYSKIKSGTIVSVKIAGRIFILTDNKCPFCGSEL